MRTFFIILLEQRAFLRVKYAALNICNAGKHHSRFVFHYRLGSVSPGTRMQMQHLYIVWLARLREQCSNCVLLTVLRTRWLTVQWY